MTTYAPNFTPRLKLKYVAAGIEHTIQARAVRGASGSTTDGLKTHIQEIFTLWVGGLAEDFDWISAEMALTDSDVFNPVAVPDPVVGEQLLSSFSLKQRCRSTGFVGQTADSRASIYLYGILWEDGLGTPADNGRVTPAEEANVIATKAILDTHFRAGNGGDAIWHNYANIKDNDRLLKLLRRGVIS